MKLWSFLSVSLMAALLAHAAFAQQPTAEAAAETISTAQPPFVPQDVPTVRQGTRPEITLAARAQRVVFVKSQAADAKTAISNILLSDAGLSLITMALAPQMRMWNPYMNDGIRKGVDLGKGMLVGHGSDTRGFEYDTLQGDTADSTLTEGTAEFLLPVKNYLPAPDFDLSTIQPVLLKLEPRERDHARLLTSRQVELKQNKTGRLDLKPTVERLETSVNQNCVPASVERLPGGVFKVVPLEPLLAGEYAIVFRTASPRGSNTQNVALKLAAQPAPPSGLADSTPAGPNWMREDVRNCRDVPNQFRLQLASLYIPYSGDVIRLHEADGDKFTLVGCKRRPQRRLCFRNLVAKDVDVEKFGDSFPIGHAPYMKNESLETCFG